MVEGAPLELRAPRHPGGEPWRVVAEVAAAVHGLETTPFVDLPGHPTRRHHAEASLAAFEGLDDPFFREVQTWAREHLPPATPAALLHGDLLGQNILLSFEEELPGLIDWEAAILGDPAYDLAIVTRGHRNPFQTPGGLHHLLEAYAGAGGVEVTAEEVQLHELAMVAGWYREASAREPGEPGYPPATHLQQLRGIFRRVTGGVDV